MQPVMINVISAVKDVEQRFPKEKILVIETGTIRRYQEGHESTRHIAETLGGRGRLISIDNSKRAIAVSKNVCKNCSNITWICSDSISFLKRLTPKTKIHFAFLDSANNKKIIFKEFMLILPHLKPGGIVMIDDAGIRLDGKGFDASKAQKGRWVWRFITKRGVRPQLFPTPGGHGKQLRIDVNRNVRRKLLGKGPL